MAADAAEAWLAHNVRARMAGLSAKTLERIHRDDSRRQVERDVAGELLRELGEVPLAVDGQAARARREHEEAVIEAEAAGRRAEEREQHKDTGEELDASLENLGADEPLRLKLEGRAPMLLSEMSVDQLFEFVHNPRNSEDLKRMALRELDKRGDSAQASESIPIDQMREAAEKTWAAERDAAVERRAAARKAAREPGGEDGNQRYERGLGVLRDAVVDNTMKGFPEPWPMPDEAKPTRIAISANAELAQQFAAQLTAAGFPCSAQKCHRIAGIPGDQKDAFVVNYRDDETEVGMVAVWWGRKHFKAYLEIVGGSHLTDETAAAFTGFLTEARKALVEGAHQA